MISPRLQLIVGSCVVVSHGAYTKRYPQSEFPGETDGASIQEWISVIVGLMILGLLFIAVKILWLWTYFLIRCCCGWRCCCDCAEKCAGCCGAQNLDEQNRRYYTKKQRLVPVFVLLAWVGLVIVATIIGLGANSTISAGILGLGDSIVDFANACILNGNKLVDGMLDISDITNTSTTDAIKLRGDLKKMGDDAEAFNDSVKAINNMRQIALNLSFIPMAVCAFLGLCIGATKLTGYSKVGHHLANIFVWLTVVASIVVWATYMVHLPLAVAVDDTCAAFGEAIDSGTGPGQKLIDSICDVSADAGKNVGVTMQVAVHNAEDGLKLAYGVVPLQFQVDLSSYPIPEDMNATDMDADQVEAAVKIVQDSAKSMSGLVRPKLQAWRRDIKALQTAPPTPSIQVCDYYTGRSGPCPDCSSFTDKRKVSCENSCLPCSLGDNNAIKTLADQMADAQKGMVDLADALDVSAKMLDVVSIVVTCDLILDWVEAAYKVMCSNDQNLVTGLSTVGECCAIIGIFTIVALSMAIQIQKTRNAIEDKPSQTSTKDDPTVRV